MSAGEVVGTLDIGGTHVTAARVDVASAAVDARSRVRLSLPAAAGRAELLAAISSAALAIRRADTRRFGVAVPGPFDYSTGVAAISHKLQGLFGVDLRSELRSALRLPDPAALVFLNDAEAFLLGEWWAGAARGHARAVGITLGTGLGSAFLENGRIVRVGPEVPPGGALYQLEFRGAPVERTISRGGLLARYGGSPENGGDVEQIAGRARAGERAARRLFDELAASLAEFLTPWLRAFGPTCLVVGGSIARSWDLLEGGLRTGLEVHEWLGTVRAAEWLDDAPLLGAARYVTSGVPC